MGLFAGQDEWLLHKGQEQEAVVEVAVRSVGSVFAHLRVEKENLSHCIVKSPLNNRI